MRRAVFSWLVLAAILCFAALSATRSAPVDAPVQVDPARHKGYVETIPGTKVSFEMAAIPGGRFLMGSPAAEKGGEDERPRHPVAIRPFWMGKCEVTWDEYDRFVEHSRIVRARPGKAIVEDFDAVTGPSDPYADETWGFGRSGYPVIGMTHHAAMQYCLWLSLKTKKTYRLPTEAEWEWAARAGTRTAYCFGDKPDKLGEHAWYQANSGEVTHPVGKKRPNPWGLYDIYGNAAEWCLDLYRKDQYKSEPAGRLLLSPVVLPDNRYFGHVARGGSWDDPAAMCRSAARRGSDASWNRLDPMRPPSIWWLSSAELVGFRVVRAVEEQENLRGLRSQVSASDLEGWRKK
jgi:formylglycine-generating enzyme required for sulfatase activity